MNNVLDQGDFQLFSTDGTLTQGPKIFKAHHQFFRRHFIIKTSVKIALNSSIAKIIIIFFYFKNNVYHF
jgi:hypothetical protein